MKQTISAGINRKIFLGFGFAAMLFAALAAQAGDGITVDNAWTTATQPGQSSTSLQLSITSTRVAKLVAITTPAASSADIHSMTHHDGKMEMKKLDSIPLPAGKKVDFKTSGTHIMLDGLKQPLQAGGNLPFTLTVQYADGKKESFEGKAEIRAGRGGKHDMDDMKDMTGM
ncbi:MAG: copper chaperone PCu(A)C [Gallionellaceae bacterium]|jgi:copper(I)-binding protein|nr:copper chaperone PCu(A)C [Gallionellaceae bacterium]